MRSALLALLLAAPLLADITHSGGGMNPMTARVVRTNRLAPGVGWSDWDLCHDGSTVGIADGQHVRFFNTWTGKETAKIRHSGESIHDTAISGDGRLYALTLDAGRVEIYSAGDKKKVGSFPINGGFC